MPEQNNFFTENKYPTLYVKNFGKIKEAEIELAPFTLFIGDNNSGKSYLLNLIWGLQKEALESFFDISKNEDMEKEKAYIDIFNKLDSILELPITKEEKIKIDLDKTDINNIMILINKNCHKSKNDLIKRLFNSDDVSADEVSLFIPKETNIDVTFSTREQKEATTGVVQYMPSSIDWNINSKETGGRGFLGDGFSVKKILFKSIVDCLMQSILRVSFFSNNTHPEWKNPPAFFPTSRTGFLLTYKELAKKAISETYQIKTVAPDVSSTIFLHSTVSFINMLFSFDLKHDTALVKDIIEYIEKEVIHGKLFMHPETMEALYTPEGTEIQLKMHMTSAVVTELAPLILYLKYHDLANAIFMEEPEISLHPELQQKITRVLIKLINTCDQQVFIATHSDTITQHINNMIKLANNPPERQQELLTKFEDNYDENDMIDQDRVRMYQFDEEAHETKITKLESSKIGFTTDTFNNFLYSVADQTELALKDLEI